MGGASARRRLSPHRFLVFKWEGFIVNPIYTYHWYYSPAGWKCSKSSIRILKEHANLFKKYIRCVLLLLILVLSVSNLSQAPIRNIYYQKFLGILHNVNKALGNDCTKVFSSVGQGINEVNLILTYLRSRQTSPYTVN